MQVYFPALTQAAQAVVSTACKDAGEPCPDMWRDIHDTPSYEFSRWAGVQLQLTVAELYGRFSKLFPCLLNELPWYINDGNPVWVYYMSYLDDGTRSLWLSSNLQGLGKGMVIVLRPTIFLGGDHHAKWEGSLAALSTMLGRIAKRPQVNLRLSTRLIPFPLPSSSLWHQWCSDGWQQPVHCGPEIGTAEEVAAWLPSALAAIETRLEYLTLRQDHYADAEDKVPGITPEHLCVTWHNTGEWYDAGVNPSNVPRQQAINLLGEYAEQLRALATELSQ